MLPFHFFVYEKELKYYNEGRKNINKLLTEFSHWMERLRAVDDQEIPSRVKGSLQKYACNVAVALTGNYKRISKEVEQYMGGRVMQYSPVDEMINEAVDKAVNKVKVEKDIELKKMQEHYEAEIAKLKAECAAIKYKSY